MGATSYAENRKAITMDKEIASLRTVFDTIKDLRAKNVSHKLSDIFMSGYAMFSLKYPSLLDFHEQTEFERENLKNIYNIKTVCSDDQLRRVLDAQDPDFIRQLFPQQFKKLKKVGLLKEYGYKIGSSTYLIVSCDGVQHFSSKTISCPCCLKQAHQNGTCTYHHNMLCAVLVHPERREVFTLNTEPIIRQDGTLKEDCERNAAKRLQKNMKLDYGAYQQDYKFLFVEDALYANAPHIKELLGNGFNYLLNVKPDSHKTLFAQIEGKRKRNQLNTFKTVQNGITHEFEFTNNVLLCNAHPDVRVNFIQYQQTDKNGKKTTFTWITNITISSKNVFNLMKAARARWKIENETFNTLKNIGYRFEHNYGHGEDHLATMFAYLMLFAFYTDQLVQACCHIFKQIENKIRTKIRLWNTIKAIFQTTFCKSMNFIYLYVANLFAIQLE